MRLIKNILKTSLRKLGYEIQRVDVMYEGMFLRNFHKQSSASMIYNWEESKETVASLKKKYERPVIGNVSMFNLLNLLGRCIDPGDAVRNNVNQLAHSLLMAEEMEKDGINNPDLLIAALVHDLGKIAFCINTPINDSEKTDEFIFSRLKETVPINALFSGSENEAGLDQCIVQWTHGEFIYLRLKNYLPDPISWLIRYHSLIISDTEPFLNERDRLYLKRYQKLFRKYDQSVHSTYKLPTKKVENYRDLINRYFPEPILF